MQIELFSLCDAATNEGGKLNLLGAFDSIGAAQFPVVHPQCAIALRIRFSRIEEGEHTLKVQFVDGDGKNILPPMQGPIQVANFGRNGSIAGNFVFNLHGLKLETAGEYSIDLAIDGQHKASLPLFAVEKNSASFS